MFFLFLCHVLLFIDCILLLILTVSCIFLLVVINSVHFVVFYWSCFFSFIRASHKFGTFLFFFLVSFIFLLIYVFISFVVSFLPVLILFMFLVVRFYFFGLLIYFFSYHVSSFLSLFSFSDCFSLSCIFLVFFSCLVDFCSLFLSSILAPLC